ncbi:hypothetical protein LINGRAHAP2_LOCUS7633, partial [Linum grandiflorum]
MKKGCITQRPIADHTSLQVLKYPKLSSYAIFCSASCRTCFFLFSSSAPLLVFSSDSCDTTNQPDRHTLRPDQITVLINGYSEYRIPLLQLIAVTYSAS